MDRDFITDEEMMNLEKSGSVRNIAMPDFIPDDTAESFFSGGNGKMNKNKFVLPPAPTPAAKVSTQNKIATANAEAAKYKAEEKKANSVLGFLGNFGKAFVKNIAPS